MTRKCYAHSVEGVTDPELGWEPLDRHLREVARGSPSAGQGAEGKAAVFGAAEWGRLAGLWHDLGKYSDAFQDYLLRENGLLRNSNAKIDSGRVDHSTFGAQLAVSKGPVGWPIAYAIAGHHSGLGNFVEIEARLKKQTHAPYAPAEFLQEHLPSPPVLSPPENPRDSRERAFQIAFWMRMLFSSLVDADFLATEAFLRPCAAVSRGGSFVASIPDLRIALDRFLARFGTPRSRINRLRNGVLEACRDRSKDPPGIFSLTVPTGGGKTLSSLAFALRHAERHNLRRVIYAIPFTSIIEQNADVFRDVLADAGERVLIEHHSNFDGTSSGGDESEERSFQTERWARLACENWDAPLVVTTNVQFFESLFHNRTSRCRKLHAVAKSVIVLDEAQALPVGLLKPTLMAIEELVRNYHCSVVLCTATQPALTRSPTFPIGIGGKTEIIPDVDSLFRSLKRVHVEPPVKLENEALADAIASQQQMLCIVHTKRQAQSVYESVCARLGESEPVSPEDRTCLHLSTNMCAEHRAEVIRIARARLESGLPCRVVSTSLIEAGVDIDFPAVYRAMAGLDSIAQAAGRCNRNGALDRLGRVVVFESEEDPPMYAREGIRDARTVIGRHADPLSPEAIEDYFREHFWQHEDRWDEGALDREGVSRGSVMECFNLGSSRDAPFVFDFRTAAERYRLITDDQVPVVVPWGQGEQVIQLIRALREYAGRDLYRRCQRFTVGLRRHAVDDLAERGILEVSPFMPGAYMLAYANLYSDQLGLLSSRDLDPSCLIEGG